MCPKGCQRRFRQEWRIWLLTPLFLAESFAQLIDAIRNETMKKIVLLKFQGAMNGAVASGLNCTQRTIERNQERIRRIWIEAGLHDGQQ